MKKRSFSRVLALLLTMSLVTSLLPAAFAAGREQDTTGGYKLSFSTEKLELSIGDTNGGDVKVDVIAPDDTDTKGYKYTFEWKTEEDAITLTNNETIESEFSTNYVHVTPVSVAEGVKITVNVTVIQPDGTEYEVSGECTVVVSDPTPPKTPVDSITISQENVNLVVGGEAQLTATVSPDNATDKTVTWKSGDTSVATVSANGLVKAIKKGTATITATAADGKSATCTVSVTDPVRVTGLTLNRSTISGLSIGGTETLIATVAPSNATNPEVEWKSSNENIVSVVGGVVTGVGIGSATITATSKDNPNANAICTVTVSYAPTTGITVAPNAVSVKVGEQAVVSASVEPSSADPSNVLWSITGNNEIASINTTTGRTVTLTGAMAGTAILTARAVSGGQEATCEVTVPGIRVTYKGEELRSGQVIELPLNGQVTFGIKTYGDAPSGSATWTSGSVAAAYFTNAASGVLCGQSLGATEIKATLGSYSFTFTVRVVENTANTIPWSMTGGQSLEMSSLYSQLRTVYKDAMEATGATNVNTSDLYYLTNLRVATSQGVLYYNYVSSSNHGYGVGATERYYLNPTAGLRGLSDVTFIPSANFSGTADIAYTGFDVNGRSFTGTIRVTVTGSKDVTYSTGQNTPVTFRGDDFNTAYRETTGRDIRYVTFDLPTSDQGTLYYNYIGTGQYASRVTSTERYTRTTTPTLDQVTFLPAPDFYGTVAIVYHIVDTGGYTSTGRVTITVSNQNQGATGDVTYSATRGETVNFSAANFQTACLSVLDESLDYVYFAPPDSTLGTLWYRYSSNSSSSRVQSTTRYYSTNSTTRPGVGGVYFVPTSTTVGVVEIPFTAYSTGGHRFTGTVVLNYSDIGEGEVTYSVRAGQPLQFNAPDFNEAVLGATGETFSYLTFDRLPTTSQGTLYYNFYSLSSTGSKATVTTRFYRTGTSSTALSRAAFIPSASYAGVVELPFTAYSSTGTRVFSGTVTIQVESGNALIVRYTTYTGRSVAFNAADFNAASLAATGANLNYVRFTLPATTQGRMYLNYDASKSYNTTVSAYSSYYRTGTSSQLIDRISFVAAANYTGTVEFPYVGTSTTGTQFNGTVVVTVAALAAQSITFSANSLPMTFNAASFYRASSDVLPNGLSYIQFTNLPASSQGVLYASYSATDPKAGTRAVLSSRYYYNGTPSIGQLVFVPKAGYSGQVSLGYSAYNAAGERVTGTVTIAVTSQTNSTRFNDMSTYPWAAPAVDFLSNAGIIAGVGEGRFAPGDPVKRGDMILMLCRALGLSTGGTYSYSDVPASAYYAPFIATAKDLGLVTSSNGLFYPESPMLREDVIVAVYRGLQSAGYSVPYASTSILYQFSDNASISAYARDAVAAMVQMGIIAGNADGTMAPQSGITRAEAAVILHKLLTQ